MYVCVPRLKMNVVVCNNKCRGRGALAGNVEWCFSRWKYKIDEAPIGLVYSKYPFARWIFRWKLIVLHSSRKSRKIKNKPWGSGFNKKKKILYSTLRNGVALYNIKRCAKRAVIKNTKSLNWQKDNIDKATLTLVCPKSPKKIRWLRRCETLPSPPFPDRVGIENCKQLFSPLLAFTTQKIATHSTDIISTVCVAFFGS